MLTRTCTLTAPDGQTLAATVTAEAPEQNPAITYVGNLDLLTLLSPDKFTTASPAFLQQYFQVLARDGGYQLAITDAGEYDNWAE